MAALRQDFRDDEEETLDALVARIKASGRGTLGPPPSQEATNAYIAHVQATPPLSEEERLETHRAWLEIREEMRARDRADDVAEGRG